MHSMLRTMTSSTFHKALFSTALAAVMALGFVQLSTPPAAASFALDCTLYEREECYWEGWIDGCCYFEGPGCSYAGYRIGPCVDIFP